MNTPQERQINIISEETQVEGKIVLDQTARIHGSVRGELHGTPGSILVLCESGSVRGDVFADTILIDGFIQGNIHARTKVHISGTGRVVGNIDCPKFTIEFGGFFEGSAKMDGERAPTPNP